MSSSELMSLKSSGQGSVWERIFLAEEILRRTFPFVPIGLVQNARPRVWLLWDGMRIQPGQTFDLPAASVSDLEVALSTLLINAAFVAEKIETEMTAIRAKLHSIPPEPQK